MTTILITGDRSIDPLQAVTGVAMTMKLLALNKIFDEDTTIVTGDAPKGVERAVRYLFEDATNLIIKPRPMTEGKPDHDAYAKELSTAGIDVVYVLHGDPMGSKITTSLFKHFDGDKVKLVLQDGVE